MTSNFMIGMFGSFDEKKYSRDFRDNFFGIEACLFEREADIDILVQASKKKDFKIGIHFPLRAGRSKLRDMQFMSQDEEIKSEAFRLIEDELIYIKSKEVNPHYILFHYPKPVILKQDFNMTNWRFADSSEYVYESSYSYEEFKSSSEYLFNWFSVKSAQYDFVPVLELDALNKYITKEEYLERLLCKYDKIKICLDIGRLHLQSRIDCDFEPMKIIKRFARYAEVVHLWNVRVKGNLTNSHFPALPTLKTEDGWADVEKYMSIIFKENPKVKVMFEHRSDLITENELAACYRWIEKMSR